MQCRQIDRGDFPQAAIVEMLILMECTLLAQLSGSVRCVLVTLSEHLPAFSILRQACLRQLRLGATDLRDNNCPSKR
jgi:hypothetical protein